MTRPSRSRVRTEEQVWPWDPAGGSFVIRRARVTGTAVQAGAESARAIMALIAHSTVRKRTPGALLPRCCERGHTRALGIEESVILVTV